MLTSDSLLPTKMEEDEVLCLTPPTRREAEAIFRAKIKRKKEEEERSVQLASVVEPNLERAEIFSKGWACFGGLHARKQGLDL